MYANDLRAVLWMLKKTRSDWLVYIEPPGDHTDHVDELWLAQLSLADGNMLTCQVRSRVDGRLLLGGIQALLWLESVLYFAYKLEAITLHSASISTYEDSLVVFLEHVPRCTTSREKGVITSLPRKQRQVFKLVDGNRTVAQIAAMLQQSLDSVGEALNALQAMGVIDA